MTTAPRAASSPRDLPGRIAGWAENIAMAALLAMAALVVAQVIARDGLHLGLAWADELARYAGLTIVYLTAPLLLLYNKHVLVDILVNLLSERGRTAIECLNEALMLAFCVLYLWGGWAFMERAGKFSTPALGMPNLMYYSPVMLGMILLCVAALVRFAHRLARLGRGDFNPQVSQPGEPAP